MAAGTNLHPAKARVLPHEGTLTVVIGIHRPYQPDTSKGKASKFSVLLYSQS